MAELTYNQVAKIKVFGVGGAGSNAVNRMVQEGVQGVEFYIANTDLQAMDISPVANKIQLGKEGLGAGGNPDNGRKAAVESEDAIRKSMEGADMVFLTAGMGGGTGTGAWHPLLPHQLADRHGRRFPRRLPPRHKDGRAVHGRRPRQIDGAED